MFFMVFSPVDPLKKWKGDNQSHVQKNNEHQFAPFSTNVYERVNKRCNDKIGGHLL